MLTHFSCNFGFQQKVTDSSVLYSGVDPFRDLEVVDTCDSSPCYLVEGSDSSGDLRVDASVSPDINYQDYIAAGADTTQTGVEGVFQQFPTGGLGSNSGTRNPLAVCQVDYGCPTGN